VAGVTDAELYRLGLLLGPPSLFGEFIPEPLTGQPADTPLEPRWGDAVSADVHDALTSSVARAIGDASHVAVAWSAGLDSTAVLLEASKFAEVTAVSWNPACAPREALLKQLVPGASYSEVIPGPHHAAHVAYGPDLSALPAVRFALAQRAIEVGSSMMFTGSGADEVCLASDFALSTVTRQSWSPELRHDLRRTSARTWAIELAGVILALTPSRVRTRAWRSIARSHWTDRNGLDLLTEPWRGLVKGWSGNWVHDQRHLILEQNWSLAQASAWYQKYPSTTLPSYSAMPEHHPFEDPVVVHAALSVPLHLRYSPNYEHQYWRTKRLVCDALPKQALTLLGGKKDNYSAPILAEPPRTVSELGPAIEAGLLSPSALCRALERRDSGSWRDAVALTVSYRIAEWIRWHTQETECNFDLCG